MAGGGVETARVWVRKGDIEEGEGEPEVGSVAKKESESTEKGCCKVGREITIGSAVVEGYELEGGTEADFLAMYTCFPFRRGNQD